MLVVEDDRMFSYLITTYLDNAGFVTRVVTNGAEVVAALAESPAPTLVVMDVGLPDANGFDILRRMRAHADLTFIPVLMLTGHAAPADVLEGLASGADGYLTKPFVPQALLMAVDAVMTLAYTSNAGAA